MRYKTHANKADKIPFKKLNTLTWLCYKQTFNTAT